jgi:DNA-binding MarR family transcriptional regulator
MASARWLTPSEDRAWRGYRRLHKLLDLQVTRDLARESGLSDADYDVLSTLTEGSGPPWRANELAARLLWSTSRLAHQVGRMERRGLVRREPCADDRRGASIHLTDEGWAVLRKAAPAHVASVRENFIDLLSPAEIAVLGDIADKVVAKLAGAGGPDPG